MGAKAEPPAADGDDVPTDDVDPEVEEDVDAAKPNPLDLEAMRANPMFS